MLFVPPLHSERRSAVFRLHLYERGQRESVYLPGPVYEALRQVAFKERCKIHDLVMQGVDLALRKRGYPSVDAFKVVRKR
jgi:hypothetical protein